MKTLVIYDSVFGNTEKIAQAVGNAVKAEVKKAADVNEKDLEELELLVVGSPTRGFRPIESVSKFLKALPANSFQGVKAAAFDTRIPLESIRSKAFRFIVKKGGYASPLISKELTKNGAIMITAPEGFFVKESEGPLVEGELERAIQWAKLIQ